MLKKIMNALTGIIATAVSGVCLLMSLILPRIFEVNLPLYLDPAWISVLVSGTPLAYKAVKKLIFNKGIERISSALLISIAMISAIVIGDLFAAGEVAFIMEIGEILEDVTTARARKGLKSLIALAPTTGRIIEQSGERIVDAQSIRVGDILRILPGERIPVDGEIISGQTSIDQSIMTGESLPVDKGVGESVFCGTINRFGSIDISASKVGEDSSLQKLIHMVKEAEEKKAPMQRIADKWASWLVPAALLLAVISGVITKNTVVAVTVLVVFCPCALVLATPTAIMAAIGQATKRGVIIKSGEALEKLGRVDTVALDKTGTLTHGRPEVSDVIAFSDLSTEELLSLASSAEAKSEHPLAKAVVDYAKAGSVQFFPADEFFMEAGRGVTAVVSGDRILCGSRSYLQEKGVDTDSAAEVIKRLTEQGKALILVARKQALIGIIALSDTLKDNVEQTVTSLKKSNTDTVLLTGDNRRTAEYFAAKVGITEVRAELLPEDKVKNILELQSSGKKVCMIGDGVNDAPALKAADVGIAMGTMGSDIAVEAADIALVGDDISKLGYLKRLSVATVRTIRFSIALSLFINFFAIVLSVLSLLTPTTGALVHNAGSIFVILIAALLYDRKFDSKSGRITAENLPNK